MIAVSPSLISSPVRAGSESFNIFFSRAYELNVLVRAFLNPARWVPPSGVITLFTKLNVESLNESLCCNATSTYTPFCFPSQ